MIFSYISFQPGLEIDKNLHVFNSYALKFLTEVFEIT